MQEGSKYGKWYNSDHCIPVVVTISFLSFSFLASKSSWADLWISSPLAMQKSHSGHPAVDACSDKLHTFVYVQWQQIHLLYMQPVGWKQHIWKHIEQLSHNSKHLCKESWLKQANRGSFRPGIMPNKNMFFRLRQTMGIKPIDFFFPVCLLPRGLK